MSAYRLAKHNILDLVIAARICLAANIDGSLIRVEYQRVTDELVMHSQHGAAIGGDSNL